MRELHRAGIEVILDVVYNHTRRGQRARARRSASRGIDNPTYYALAGPADEPGRYYLNYTGCGNSLNLASPPVIRLVMDSLRYWVEVMHVDGFRFDLASVLGRAEDGTFRTSSARSSTPSRRTRFSRRVKLIAEPWDLGTYQVGNFPVDWSEWNGRFRDTVRQFGKGDRGQVRDLGWRLTGSADLYGDDGRSAYNSVNFVTCHDGFTLRDLVSYNEKHNEANREGNRDGTDDNNSWNCGVEGRDRRPRRRCGCARQLVKNFMPAPCSSPPGTPMILGGDEFFRTQRGNNNAYCQDNELSLVRLGRGRAQRRHPELLPQGHRPHPRCTILQRRKFLLGEDRNGNGVPDILVVRPGPRAPPHGTTRSSARLRPARRQRGALRPRALPPVLHPQRGHRLAVRHAAAARRRARAGAASWTPRCRGGEDIVLPGAEVPLDPPGFYLVNPRSTVVLIGR